MSARAGLRFFTQRAQFQARSQLRQTAQRRSQTTARNPATEPNAVPNAVPQQSMFQRLWTSEVGIKTVHFWAPVMKWCVVIAGASDFLRPAEKLSLSQNLALMATGSIWTRWCFVIRPKNMLLAGVNFCLFLVGTIQTSRILAYQSAQKGSLEGGAKKMEQVVKDDGKRVEQQAETAAKEIKQKA